MSANITSVSYKQLEERSKIKNLLLRWFLYFVLILFASYFIFPLYVMVVTSFKTMEEIRQGTLLTWPSQLNFESWAVAWGGRGYGAGDTFLRPYFWNSIKMVVPAVIFSTFIGAMTGYVLTKWRFKGDRWVFLFLLFGCFIPYQAILLPMARTLGELGISNSILGLVVVHSVYGIPFTTLFFRNYFVSIPSELIKAARIDGAGFFKIFFSEKMDQRKLVFSEGSWHPCGSERKVRLNPGRSTSSRIPVRSTSPSCSCKNHRNVLLFVILRFLRSQNELRNVSHHYSM